MPKLQIDDKQLRVNCGGNMGGGGSERGDPIGSDDKNSSLNYTTLRTFQSILIANSTFFNPSVANLINAERI